MIVGELTRLSGAIFFASVFHVNLLSCFTSGHVYFNHAMRYSNFRFQESCSATPRERLFDKRSSMKGVLFGTGVGTHGIFGDGGSSPRGCCSCTGHDGVFCSSLFSTSQNVLIDATKNAAKQCWIAMSMREFL